MLPLALRGLVSVFIGCKRFAGSLLLQIHRIFLELLVDLAVVHSALPPFVVESDFEGQHKFRSQYSALF